MGSSARAEATDSLLLRTCYPNREEHGKRQGRRTICGGGRMPVVASRQFRNRRRSRPGTPSEGLTVVQHMTTNFKSIDFPENTLSPTRREETEDDWKLNWNYSSLLTSYAVAMHMPEKLQPGPLAGQISFFAPVSLFFFFFLIFIITTMRNIDLHPMNYFFLAAAFFAFHLLLAYLVDHLSIHLSFIICSLVSIFLVISYLRLVVNMRFALLEAGGAQFVYLVLFSYAFFSEGFTGLAVTIGAIVTLFVVMQLTARLSWVEKFSGRRVSATSADGR